MGRTRSSNPDLARFPRLRRRKLKGGERYYYDHPSGWREPLGSDLIQALQRCERIKDKPAERPTTLERVDDDIWDCIRSTDPNHPIYEGMTHVEWYAIHHAELFLPLETLQQRRLPWPSVEPPSDSGIYFLWDEDELIYVGQSFDIFGRLRAHEKTRYFSHVSYVSCPELTLNKLEKEYIRALEPPLNIRDNPGAVTVVVPM